MKFPAIDARMPIELLVIRLAGSVETPEERANLLAAWKKCLEHGPSTSQKISRSRKDVGGRLSAPIRPLPAVVIGRPVAAAPVVMSLCGQDHPALGADAQRSLPEIKFFAVEAALPGLFCRQLRHQKAFLPGGFSHSAS